MVDVHQRDMAVRPVEESDRPTVEWLTTQLWGAAEVAVHDGVFYPATLPGFIAERAGRIAGLVTFEVRPAVLEIVTINALDLYQGIGTLLIEAVRAEAKRQGCHQITLTTTNDNIGALRFYQRRGFRLAALRPGAVDRSRQRKPEIPRTGDFGIPLRDEIDLSCPVSKGKNKIDDLERNRLPLTPHQRSSGAASRSAGAPHATRPCACCPEPGQCAIQGLTTVRGSTMLPPVRVRTAGHEPVPVVDSVHAAIGVPPLLLRPVLGAFRWHSCRGCSGRSRCTAACAPSMASLYVAAFGLWIFCVDLSSTG